ncbi:MAG: MMPL family transporter, partial [Alphaproteobacteria bacterium]
LIVGLGSLRLVLAVLVTLVTGLIWTAAFAAVAIGSLNLLSVAFAVLFIGLAVDFGIHFSLRVREEVDSGQPVSDALSAATVGVGGALTLCAIAAAIGFYAFLPTDYRGLAELGLISGTSMVIALLLNLTLLPALIAIMPPRARPRRLGAVINGIERTVRRRHKGIVLGACALGIAAAFAAPGVHFNFDPLNLKDPTSESVQTAMELRADPKSTTLTIAVLTPGMEEATRLASRLATLPEVDHVVTPASFVPSDQDEKLATIQDMALILMPVVAPPSVAVAPTSGEDEAALQAFRQKLAAAASSAAMPDALRAATVRMESALAAFTAATGGDATALQGLEEGLVGLLPSLLAQLGQALDAGPVTLADVPESAMGRYIASDGRVKIDVHPSENLNDIHALRKFVQAVRDVAPNATDSPVTLVEAGDAVITAILQASALALAAIVVLLLVLLGRPTDVLLVLFPLLLAGLWTLATAALLDLPFNFANVIVLPLLLGLGVASGIHLVMRGRAGRAADADPETLLRTTTPRAVVFSALTTIGSFGSLAVSSHRGTASMGELLTIAIGFTLVAALLVLPSLLTWLDTAAARRDRGAGG